MTQSGSFVSAKTVGKEIEAAANSAKSHRVQSPIKETILGANTPFAEFREMYSSVWDQIRSKNYLMFGRVIYTTRLYDIEITLRSLSKKEQLTLSSAHPAHVGPPKDTSAVRSNLEYIEILSLIPRLVKIADITFPDTNNIMASDWATWVASPSTQQSIEALSQMDPVFIELLWRIVEDVEIARRSALQEDALRPSNPPSPTTA